MARPDQQESTDTTVLSRAAGIAGIAYVVVFFAAGFPTGIGDHFYGLHPTADVVVWAVANAGVVHAAVPLHLANDWLFLIFAFVLVGLSGGRRLPAVIAYAGLAVADAVFAVILGLQYAVPQLATLPDGAAVAQAAVVLQGSLEFSLHPIPFAIGLAAVGYVVARGSTLPMVFGVVVMVLALMIAVSFPLREVAPGLHAFETVSAVGVLLWTVATALALLLPRRSVPAAA